MKTLQHELHSYSKRIKYLESLAFSIKVLFLQPEIEFQSK